MHLSCRRNKDRFLKFIDYDRLPVWTHYEGTSDNNNNNANDNIYGAVIVAQSHCESSPGSCDEYGTAPSGRRPSDQVKRPGL